ncbi:MAG: hypothetical protein IJ168_02130 [Eubacterium sp.]|nr:hypothetical protein [Eubacterium sp.]
MADYIFKPLTGAEVLYAYRQPQDIASRTMFYGYYHGDFGRSGNEYHSMWEGNSSERMSDTVRADVEALMDALESDTSLRRPFHSRNAMRNFCSYWRHAQIEGNFGSEYAFRVDTDKNTYIIRMEPYLQGDYDYYVFAYDRECFNRHLHNAEKGIRFIDSRYTPLFEIADGDSIRITYSTGEHNPLVCRFIDEYHTYIGNRVYHICQFAENMERNGNTVIPFRDSLPDIAYYYSESDNTIYIAEHGNSEFVKADVEDCPAFYRQFKTKELNNELGLTNQQVAAMEAGVKKGWDSPEADPRNYTEQGEFSKNASRNPNKQRLSGAAEQSTDDGGATGTGRSQTNPYIR